VPKREGGEVVPPTLAEVAAIFGPPETTSSNRTIPASDYVLNVLSGHIGRRHDGFVIHRTGDPVHANAFSYQWRRACRRAGVVDVRFHRPRS
jgi:hypothetical protein